MKIENGQLIKVFPEDIQDGIVTIPEGITSIGAYVFRHLTGVKEVIASGEITSIGQRAFEHCTGLIRITLQKGLISIGEYAFSGCTGLEEAFVPNTVTEVGDYAFSGCTKLKRITLPEEAQGGHFRIGIGAFSGAVHLRSVTLLTQGCFIQEWAFNACRELRTVTLLQSNSTYIDQSAFQECDNLESIFIIAKSSDDFESMKKYLPQALQTKAVCIGEETFEEKINRIRTTIKQIMNQDGGGDETEAQLLQQLNKAIADAQEALEIIKPYRTLYEPLKQQFDSVLVNLYLAQNNLEAALNYFKDNSALDAETLLRLCSECFSLRTNGADRWSVKYRHLIALFGRVWGGEEPVPLKYSVLYLLKGEEVTPGEGLTDYGIERCLSLEVIERYIQEVVGGVEDESLKNEMEGFVSKLYLLTPQEMLTLLEYPIIKDKFYNSYGTAKIISYESLLRLEAPGALKPVTGSKLPSLRQFIRDTLSLIESEQRAQAHKGGALTALLFFPKQAAQYLQTWFDSNRRVEVSERDHYIEVIKRRAIEWFKREQAKVEQIHPDYRDDTPMGDIEEGGVSRNPHHH